MQAKMDYFQITHNNSLETINDETLNKLFVNLSATLIEISEEEVGKEINSFFDTLIRGNSTWDLFEINYAKTSEYFKVYHFKLKEYQYVFNEILSTDYSAGFCFNETNIRNLTKVICIVYQLFKAFAKVYKVHSHKDLMLMHREIIANKINALSLFEINNAANRNEGGRRYTLSNVNSMMSLGNNQAIRYCYPTKKGEFVYRNKYLIEFVMLINKFTDIKKVVFNTKHICDRQSIEEILIILLNRQWLFPNVTEISFDVSNEEVEHELENIFHSELITVAKQHNVFINKTSFEQCKKESDDLREAKSKLYKSNNAYYRDNSFKGKKRKTKHTNIVSYINDNSCYFTALIVYSYFISVIHPKKLFLSFNSDFTKEMELLFQKHRILLYNFTFLSLFNKISRLNELDVTLNSLDSESFGKVIGIIYNCGGIEKLRLSLFTEEQCYSPSYLFQLVTKFNKNSKNLFANMNNNDNSIDKHLLSLLLNAYENNLQLLFFALQQKRFIKEAFFSLNLPSAVIDSESYIMLILKFLVNLLLYIKQHLSIHTFSFVAPYLNFDCRKYPFLEDIIDCMEGCHSVKRFTFKAQMYAVGNLFQLFTPDIQEMHLGDLDKESFVSLISFFKENEDSVTFNALVSLTVSLKLQLVVYDDCIKCTVNDFLLFNNAKRKLSTLKLITNLNIFEKEHIRQLFDIIHYKTNAEKVHLEISNCNSDNVAEIEKELITANKMVLRSINYIFRKKTFTVDNTHQSACSKVASYLKIPQHKGIHCKH